MVFLKAVSTALCAWTAIAAPAPHGGYGGHKHDYPTGAAPTVEIKNGTIAGVYSSVSDQDYFLGVPFAQPPTGANRFRAPQPLSAKFDGTYDASAYSAACYGYGSDDWAYPVLSEDCLYLNVVRPAGYEGEKLPVAFWMHGGGLTQGSSVDQRYNLTNLVKRGVAIGKPIIGVSVNYRLSMWGFVTGEEAIEKGNANLGFKDQRLALHWLQENIGAFGGDPSKVTIWGESAGALSVGVGHLTAFGGRDDKLFRGAIMESGNPINYGTFQYNTNDFVNATSQLGCADAADKFECLRAIPTDTLNTWINSTAGKYFRWKPIIDGDYIQGKGSVQLANGDFVHVPIIDGANSDEGTAFGVHPMNTSSQFLQTLQVAPNPVLLTSEQATKVLAAYPSNITDGAVPTNQPASYIPPPNLGPASRRSDAYYGDATFIGPRRKTCQTWAAAGIDAFCYRFNTIPHGIPSSIGATHFQEVAFVFDNKLGLGYGYPNVSVNPFEGEPQAYFDLADTMSAAWVSFVHDLHPGSFWPNYADGVEGRNWVFDANVTGLGFAEDDDWRKEGIELVNSWNADVYDR